MYKQFLRYLAIIACAAPLALTACQGGGSDGHEHPSEGGGGSEHPSSGGSEHPN